MKHFSRCAILSLFCLILSISTVLAQENPEKDTKAIVIATFGTTVPSALTGIMHVRDRMQKRFPGTEVRLAFTSNMIRKIWHKRQHDEAFQKANPTLHRISLPSRDRSQPLPIFKMKGFPPSWSSRDISVWARNIWILSLISTG